MVFDFCRVNNEDSDDEEVVAPLEGMDRWTTKLVTSLVPPILKSKGVTDSQLAEPEGEGKQPVTILKTGDTEFVNLKNDPSCGKFPFAQWLKLQAIQKATLFPIDDIFEQVADEDVETLKKETQLDLVSPKPNVVFENPASDEGLTRQAFYGLGCHRVVEIEDGEDAPEGAVFKVDLMVLNQFEVRKGFAKYGSCAYFDDDQAPVAIKTADEKIRYPSDGYHWEVAKFAWRCNLVAGVTAVDHLYNLHFYVAAQMLRAFTEAFPKDHKIKHALCPFTIRTALVNNKAGTALLPKNSILHHITAFTWESLGKVAAATYKKGPEWISLPEYVKSKGPKIEALVEEGKLPIYEDGLELHAIFRSFFEDKVPATNEEVLADKHIVTFWKLLKEYTESKDLKELSRDNLLDTLANFTYYVTAGHEHVGSIAEHVETPVHGGCRMMHGGIRVDKQSFLGGLTLMALTSTRTPPLLSDFADFWKGKEGAQESWDKLTNDLRELAARVEERNENRVYKYQACNPKILECAVSV